MASPETVKTTVVVPTILPSCYDLNWSSRPLPNQVTIGVRGLRVDVQGTKWSTIDTYSIFHPSTHPWTHVEGLSVLYKGWNLAQQSVEFGFVPQQTNDNKKSKILLNPYSHSQCTNESTGNLRTNILVL